MVFIISIIKYKCSPNQCCKYSLLSYPSARLIQLANETAAVSLGIPEKSRRLPKETYG
jgi:hypothetical protein